jgi:hypothetical protein
MLALLMVGTSWAIASSASIWLVPPYLILMAWLLFPHSVGRPSGALDESGPNESDSLPPAKAGEASDALLENPALAGSVDDGSEPATSPTPPKARKGKGRGKKVKPVIEPIEATWVQVAPGKFVRVEASEASNPAGPHSSLGDSAEVDATPQPSDRAETEPVESESTTAEVITEEPESPGIFEGPSAVDGNAPQDEGLLEATESARLDPLAEAVDDRIEAEPVVGGLEDEGERSSLSEAFEPSGSPDLTDVAPEAEEEWEEPLEEADPTETTVDETDFDDAGPFVGDDPHEPDASLGGTDELKTRSTPCWPWRLAPRALNRGGHPSRMTGRPSPVRRPVRSSGPTPRPCKPRRLGRREPIRPRRITRAFPPRSPPAMRCQSWIENDGGSRGRPFKAP